MNIINIQTFIFFLDRVISLCENISMEFYVKDSNISVFPNFRYKHNVDKILTQMQFTGPDNKPRGVINWFAVHPTSMNNTNHLVSSDNVGYASILFEQMMNNDAMIGKVISKLTEHINLSLIIYINEKNEMGMR